MWRERCGIVDGIGSGKYGLLSYNNKIVYLRKLNDMELKEMLKIIFINI